jgi:hypothetical protein
MLSLTLDPAFNVDPPIFLDPSLDPVFPFSSQSSIMNGFETPTPMMSLPQSQYERASSTLPSNLAYPSPSNPSNTPTPDKEDSNGQVSPSKVTRHRGKNADKLAIEEAQKLIGKRMRQ